MTIDRYLPPNVIASVRAARRRWLVTGAGGFIGSNLVEALLALDQEVIGLDNFATGHRKNLDDVRAVVGSARWRSFEFLEGDIRDIDACRRACHGVSLVMHQAALGSVPRSIKDPVATNDTNICGSLNMLVASRDAGVSRFVFAASSSTYGDHPGLPKVENRIGRPLSPYAVTKLVNELYADVFGRTYGIETVGLRYFNVFGPRQDPYGAYAAVIPKWVGHLMAAECCAINGDGETSRDFCFVANTVQANLLAALTENRDAVGEVYNIAVGGRTTLNEVYRLIRDKLAPLIPDGESIARLEPVYGDFRAGDVKHSQADIGKAERLLGYAPTHGVSAGLEAALPWYVANLKPASTSS